jgi:hypothetical protein
LVRDLLSVLREFRATDGELLADAVSVHLALLPLAAFRGVVSMDDDGGLGLIQGGVSAWPGILAAFRQVVLEDIASRYPGDRIVNFEAAVAALSGDCEQGMNRLRELKARTQAGQIQDEPLFSGLMPHDIISAELIGAVLDHLERSEGIMIPSTVTGNIRPIGCIAELEAHVRGYGASMMMYGPALDYFKESDTGN